MIDVGCTHLKHHSIEPSVYGSSITVMAGTCWRLILGQELMLKSYTFFGKLTWKLVYTWIWINNFFLGGFSYDFCCSLDNYKLFQAMLFVLDKSFWSLRLWSCFFWPIWFMAFASYDSRLCKIIEKNKILNNQKTKHQTCLVVSRLQCGCCHGLGVFLLRKTT